MDDDSLVAAVLQREGAVPTAALPERGEESAQLFGLLVAAVVVTAHGESAATVDAVGSLLGRWRTPAEIAAADPADVRKTLGASVEGGDGSAVDDVASDLADAVHDLAVALRDDAVDPVQLRRGADGDPEVLVTRVAGLPGVGDVAAEAFVRELQVRWPELYPYAGATAVRAARELGIAADTEELAAHVDGADGLRRLAGALARLDRDGAHDEVRARAAI